MKTITVIALLLLTVFHAKAQETFGKASFAVPSGWQTTKTNETVTLQPAPKKGVICKIIISATEKGGVVTAAEHLASRNLYGGKDITYETRKGTTIKYEADGLTCFFSKGTTTINMIRVNSYFYTLSNGQQTFYYQLLTSNNECINEFNQFVETLTMQLEETGLVNAKKRSPSTPMAPAPVM